MGLFLPLLSSAVTPAGGCWNNSRFYYLFIIYLTVDMQYVYSIQIDLMEAALIWKCQVWLHLILIEINGTSLVLKSLFGKTQEQQGVFAETMTQTFLKAGLNVKYFN